MLRRAGLVFVLGVATVAGCTALASLDEHQTGVALADGAAPDDSAIDAGLDAIPPDTNAPADAGPDTADARINTKGDVVVLTGATLTQTGNNVTAWNNANTDFPALVALPMGTPQPTVTLIADAGNERCAVFSGGPPLRIAGNEAINFDLDDFSAWAVVRRTETLTSDDYGRVVLSRNGEANGMPAANYKLQGFALMTEWQKADVTLRELKYAGRMFLNQGPTVFEVVEPTVNKSGRDVIAMYRRNQELYLRVNAVTYGPMSGAQSYRILGGPLMVGQVDDDSDTSSRYVGDVCAIIVHRGPETNQQLDDRYAALRARYPSN